MAEEVVKTIENVDKLFSEIVVNGEVHKSNRYTSPSAQSASPSSVRSTQGEDVHAVELNEVLHNFSDPDVISDVQTLQQGLANEVSARTTTDQALDSAITQEANARSSADGVLQTNINTVSGDVSTLQGKVNTIESEIPAQASSSNQLADKNFVNSSIATNTANFLGTYTSLADIEAIQNPTNNDYVFLQTTDSAGNSVFDRYKYNAEQDEWLFEYELNNSSFTAEQWATINSGLTQSSVTQEIEDAIAEYVYVSNLPTDAVLHYSFDEVPDYPDGSAVEKYINNFTSVPTGWDTNSRGTLSVSGGKLINTITNGTNPWIRRYYSSTSSVIIKIKVKTTVDCAIYINYYDNDTSSYRTIASLGNAKAGQDYALSAYVPRIDFILIQAVAPSATDFQLILSEYYLGDGSYTTPVIDNANGQNNGTNYGGIATQGLSGKGVFFPSANQEVRIPTTEFSAPNSNNDITISCWVKKDVGYTPDTVSSMKPLISIGAVTGTFGLYRRYNEIGCQVRDTISIRTVQRDITDNNFHHIVAVFSGSTHTMKLYIDGDIKGETAPCSSNYQFGSGHTYWRIWSNYVIGGSGTPDSTNQPATLDDILVFNRALSQEEITALYFNKANTPKYYPQPTDKIEQNNWGLATSGGVYKAFGGLKTYEVVIPDFQNTLLIADITTWYNSTSSETTQLVYFAGLMTAYRGGSPVCYTGTIQLYVSNYRSGQRINDIRSSVRINGVANRDITFEAEVVEYNNRQYLAIKRNSDQSVTLRFLVSTNSDFEPLFTGLDRRTETITEIFKDISYPIAPRESGTYNLQCVVSASGVPTYQWVAV